MYYVWDPNKNERNYRKHGIRFEDAVDVFDDPYRVERFDRQHSTDEERYITIGRAGKILFVVYTERKSSIRLISARLATPTEEDAYYASNLFS